MIFREQNSGYRSFRYAGSLPLTSGPRLVTWKTIPDKCGAGNEGRFHFCSNGLGSVRGLWRAARLKIGSGGEVIGNEKAGGD